MALSPKQLAKIVERRHPAYKTLLPHWDFMEACYVGGREWFSSNIFRYLKEGDTEFKDRVERAYRFNHSREVVDLVNKYLFRTPIARRVGDAPESVKRFWRKSTRHGLSIDEFMRIASTRSSIGGRPWVIVDNAVQAVDETTSQAEAGDPEIYAYVVRPQDVLDLSYDEVGNLNWILVREIQRDDEDPVESSGTEEECYRLWTRTEWMLIAPEKVGSKKMVIRDAGVHGLGLVPAVKVDHTMSDDPWSCPALIADVAYLDRACANYASNLDAIIQDQTFSQLAMPAQNVLPGDDAYKQIVEMGTKRIFLYDGEGGKGPEYLSPDPRQAALIINAIQQIINEIYHSVGLAGERTKQDNAKGIDNSSGVAKAVDFERVTALLIAKSDSLETAENKIARIVALWAGEAGEIPEESDLVIYSDTFDVRGLQDEIDIAMQLAVMDLPETVRAEQLKGLVRKLFVDASEDEIAAFDKRIEDWAADLKKKAEMSMETMAAGVDAAKEAGGSVLGEAKRNRDRSGSKQSDTKSRETGTS